MNRRDTIKVAQCWGVAPPDTSKSFYGFPPIRDYLFACISGKVEHTEPDWCERWTVETYLSDKLPVSECLSLCCGFGEIERRLASMGVFQHCLGLDLSPGAVQGAKARAKAEGYENIDYEVADINTIELEPEKYDLIYCNGALHHISNLEHVVSQIYKTLKPGGILVCNEYVGPKYQQLPFRQREIVNSVIHLIPSKYRYAAEETYVPYFFRKRKWRKLLYEFYRLLTFQPGVIDVASLKPKSDWPRYKILLLNLYRSIRRLMPTTKKASFHYGKVWDENSQLIKSYDPSECVRSDEIIPILKSKFRDNDVRYYNGSILLYALDHKFFEEYDHSREEDRALLNLLINIEMTMINIGELSSNHAHIVAKKEL